MRCRDLKERVPTLKNLMAFGPLEGAERTIPRLPTSSRRNRWLPQRSHPDDVSALVYTGGTTGKPKGVMAAARSAAYMTMIQMAEWEFPDEIRMLVATPSLSRSRRRSSCRP